MGGDGDTVAPSLHQNTILCREVNTVNDAGVSIGSCSGYWLHSFMYYPNFLVSEIGMSVHVVIGIDMKKSSL